MSKQLLKNSLGWGFALWLFGYLLGILLFAVVPPSLLGWVIMPIGTAVTVWVLHKKVKARSLQSYAMIAAVWTVIAVVCDYFFLVKVFKPEDGYYKFDVYVYYALTFFLPLLIGWIKTRKKI